MRISTKVASTIIRTVRFRPAVIVVQESVWMSFPLAWAAQPPFVWKRLSGTKRRYVRRERDLPRKEKVGRAVNYVSFSTEAKYTQEKRRRENKVRNRKTSEEQKRRREATHGDAASCAHDLDHFSHPILVRAM
jgi:hypothetical protein